MKNQNQIGSARVVFIIILVIAVLGALGFIFWQNFINKPASSSDSSSSATSSELTNIQIFKSQQHGITFDYPKGWTAKEAVSSETSDEFYISKVNVNNEKGQPMTSFVAEGQLGGTCDPNSEKFMINTIFNEDISLNGVGKVRFGYTIVNNNDGTFGVAFGINSSDNNDLSDEGEVQCPTESVNNAYVKQIGEGKGPVINIQFGSSYVAPSSFDSGTSLNITKHARFNNFEAAKAYALSDEFKQIELMIKSLKIES